MIELTTSKGYNFTIADEALDDFELLEDLIAAQNGDQLRIMTACRRLLGDEQMTALKDKLRGENGRVKASEVMAVISEIFTQLIEKNQRAKK